MEQLTLEQQANYEPPIPEQYYEDGNDLAYTDGHKKGFVVGANWQKEQYKDILLTFEELARCLRNADDRPSERELIRKAIERLQD